MARMFPEQLDAETKSAAERILYRLFRDQLDENYVVFHSVAWLSLDRRRRPRDGEADFVIAHHERGLLVLEVKGGGILRNPQTGQWTTTNLVGTTAAMKNPVEQAKDCKYSLLDQLKTMIERHVNVGHALAFPDVVVSQTPLGPDLPRQIVLDATDLDRIAWWVERVMDYWRGSLSTQQGIPGKDGIHALIKLLGKQWKLKPALWGQFRSEKEQFIRLTEEQYIILDVLNRQRKALISGFAGSGKTLLAVEKATRLARQGFRVLLTCFNRKLAQDLRMRVTWGVNLDIYNFHDLCMHMAKEAGIAHFTRKEGEAVLFERDLPEALMKASALLGRTYDAIIVDEGQDFCEAWWIALLDVLTDMEHGIFYIFYDENQRIYGGHTNDFPLDPPPYLLTVNCRTTRSIHKQIVRFYCGEELPFARGPEGKPIECIRYQPGNLQQILEAQLERLVIQERIPAQEIMVLTPFSRKKSRVQTVNGQKGGIGLSWAPTAADIQIETIHSAKGLERSVIILVELDRWSGRGIGVTETEKLLYVACSRACNYLIILLPRPVPAAIGRFFETDDVTKHTSTMGNKGIS